MSACNGRQRPGARQSRAGRDRPRDSSGVVLTEREDEIVALVAQGKTNAEIASELFLSPGTVKNHLAAIQRKIDARNRVAVAAWAWATGRAAP
ncbi:helix-turn-helix transcriptional regulator [Nonomuraea sp. NPDC000554]|uniref:response regulator transcription factor n=1 Tax=Nonomuraea sp. NPDC000554 TaxID=3154259 RepID=UPI0033271805